jgi:hypothetical protein
MFNTEMLVAGVVMCPIWNGRAQYPFFVVEIHFHINSPTESVRQFVLYTRYTFTQVDLSIQTYRKYDQQNAYADFFHRVDFC